MSKLFLRIGLLLCQLIITGAVHARVWSDKTGRFQVDADMIAFNETSVVLKRPTGELLGISVNDLSTSDIEFLRMRETADKAKKSASEIQTWTSKDGMKMRGRVLAYGRKELVVQRKLGSVTFDGKRFGSIDPLHQKLLLKIVSHLENQKLEDEKGLETWARTLAGSAKTYRLEGVLLQLETGDEIGVPFFLFAPEEYAILEPGWQRWIEEKASDEQKEHESFLMRSQAMAYQQERVHRHIEMVKLELLAAATGVIGIWDVGLVPRQGIRGMPIRVVVPAANSEAARAMALARYPGYVVSGMRRANN